METNSKSRLDVAYAKVLKEDPSYTRGYLKAYRCPLDFKLMSHDECPLENINVPFISCEECWDREAKE